MEGRIQLEFTERRKERKGGPPNVQRGDERREIWNCETRGEERRGAGKGTREGNAARATKGKRRGEKGSVKLGPGSGGI